jgi:hypothetical protein
MKPEASNYRRNGAYQRERFMGSKVDGFVAGVEKLRHEDILRVIGDTIIEAMRLDADSDGVFDAADELQSIRELKALLKVAVEAVNEQVDDRAVYLYDEMLATETQNFARKGQTFYLTVDRYVQAKKELGGTSNPDLVAWLEENELGELAKKNVNANSLRSAVNAWLEDHPVEAVIDGEELEGDELLEHLGLSVDEFSERNERILELLELVNLTEKPTVGVRKAAR